MLFEKLDVIWGNDSAPFLKSSNSELSYRKIRERIIPDLSKVRPGDVVAGSEGHFLA